MSRYVCEAPQNVHMETIERGIFVNDAELEDSGMRFGQTVSHVVCASKTDFSCLFG